ncbi:hypothetical protein C8F04DRAFT_1236365 [Mycena alexandri]|uniref:Uncharacterized protein n=1 Tax=Mycena alexandri TaxID=1745969 RepID=A0AAD6SN64_9AGAR|nr:hypothetical protein C8F04DRAFT_1236365 [Mycena alexandri]
MTGPLPRRLAERYRTQMQICRPARGKIFLTYNTNAGAVPSSLLGCWLRSSYLFPIGKNDKYGVAIAISAVIKRTTGPNLVQRKRENTKHCPTCCAASLLFNIVFAALYHPSLCAVPFAETPTGPTVQDSFTLMPMNADGTPFLIKETLAAYGPLTASGLFLKSIAIASRKRERGQVEHAGHIELSPQDRTPAEGPEGGYMGQSFESCVKCELVARMSLDWKACGARPLVKPANKYLLDAVVEFLGVGWSPRIRTYVDRSRSRQLQSPALQQRRCVDMVRPITPQRHPPDSLGFPRQGCYRHGASLDYYRCRPRSPVGVLVTRLRLNAKQPLPTGLTGLSSTPPALNSTPDGRRHSTRKLLLACPSVREARMDTFWDVARPPSTAVKARAGAHRPRKVALRHRGGASEQACGRRRSSRNLHKKDLGKGRCLEYMKIEIGAGKITSEYQSINTTVWRA